jgi:hypothetical protein
MKKGFLGFLKGSMAVRIKFAPRILLAPIVGMVRGAILGGWAAITEEADKCEAAARIFEDRYLKELEEESAGTSKTT